MNNSDYIKDFLLSFLTGLIVMSITAFTLELISPIDLLKMF